MKFRLLCHYSYFGVCFSKNYALRQNIQVSFRRKEKNFNEVFEINTELPLPIIEGQS